MWPTVYAVWMQEQLASYQASLHQALFETEQTARRVANTIPEDPFAAAVVAHFWLQKISGLDVTSFGDISQKRAWSSAVETLRGAVAKAQAECNEKVRRYLVLLEESQHLQSLVGGDPRGYLARLQQQAAADEMARVSTWMQASIGGWVVAGSLAVILIGRLAESSGLLTIGVIVLFFAAILALLAVHKHMGELSPKAARSAHVAKVAAAQVEAFEQFIADPQRGGFLSQVWENHPLLFKEPAPPPSSVQSPGVQVYVDRQVVERQVVVTRCRYCSQMTPVDMAGCTHCGAAVA